jgi:hypothetical protein
VNVVLLDIPGLMLEVVVLRQAVDEDVRLEFDKSRGLAASEDVEEGRLA